MKTAIISAAALILIIVLANFFPGVVLAGLLCAAVALMVGSVVFFLAFCVWDKFSNIREAKSNV